MAGIEQIIGRRNTVNDSQDKWLLKNFDTHLKEVQRPARQGVFYPSALGSECDRYVYNCYHGLVKQEEISAVSRRIFDCGDYLGYRYEKYLEKMGILLGTELPIKSEMPPISGRLDFLITHNTHGPTIIELKSINHKGFAALTEPKPEHTVQLQIYLNLSQYEYGIVLYENKNDQKIKAFGAKKDPEKWETLANRCLAIMNLTEQPSECTGHRYCPCKREKNVKIRK
tara:strand:+ start:18544 stop:19224 length:681 start_codon:yes stop_codon:yes gene_type:complete